MSEPLLTVAWVALFMLLFPLLWGGPALPDSGKEQENRLHYNYCVCPQSGAHYAASAQARVSEVGIPPRGADDVGMAIA